MPELCLNTMFNWSSGILVSPVLVEHICSYSISKRINQDDSKVWLFLHLNHLTKVIIYDNIELERK